MDVTEKRLEYMYGALVGATDFGETPATPSEARPFANWSVEFTKDVLDELVARGGAKRVNEGYLPVDEY